MAQSVNCRGRDDTRGPTLPDPQRGSSRLRAVHVEGIVLPGRLQTQGLRPVPHGAQPWHRDHSFGPTGCRDAWVACPCGRRVDAIVFAVLQPPIMPVLARVGSLGRVVFGHAVALMLVLIAVGRKSM